MSLTRERQPYEFLVRWRDGEIAGMHVGYVEFVKDGDEVISHKILEVQEIGVATEFPLSDFLNDVQLSTLATNEELRSKNKGLEQKLQKSSDETSAALARIVELEEKLSINSP